MNSTLSKGKLCPATFEKKMKSQVYCSRKCYARAWPILNRKKNAQKSRARRKAKPEWYREKEPGYYQSYRTGQLEKRPWRYVFQARRLDAAKRNIEFTLTDEWCALQWTGRCELTGIQFERNPKKARGPYPFSCSLDRIEANKGYTPDNCRFILFGCNSAKGSGSDADLYRIALALIAKLPTNARTDSPLAPA